MTDCVSYDASALSAGGISEMGSIFLILAAIGFLPWPFFIGFCAYKLRKRLASAATAADDSGADGGGDEEDDDADGDKGDIEGEVSEVLNDFMDSAYTRGLDDHSNLEINCVMMYRMQQAKKRAREAARSAALAAAAEGLEGEQGDAGGGASGGTGRPGGLSRLGWKLTKKGAKEDDRRNMAMEVKGIEMYLSREEDIDTKHGDSGFRNTAGAGAINPGLLAVAMSKEHQSNLGRIGGRRASTIAKTAQEARQQLQVLKDTKPDLFAVKSGSANDQAYRNSVINRGAS